MYQFLLHDRAPKEGLVKADEKHPDSLYVRSKFFDDLRKHYKGSIKENLVNMQGVAKGAEIVTKIQ